MRVRGVLILLTVLASTGVASAAEFTVDVEPGEAPTYEGSEGLAELVDWTDGMRYAWNLSLPDGTTVGTFRLHDVFEVERPRQIVPRIDDSARHTASDHLHPHHFAEAPRDALRDGPTYAYNASGNGSERTIRLAFSGAGPAVLELVRDVDAPNITVGQPRNVTDHGFTLVTRTDEPALGTLHVRPVAGGAGIDFPTLNLAYRQTFPVQGLDPNTTYVYRGTVRDWANNTAVTPPREATTAATPDLPEPPVRPVVPRPGARLTEPVGRVEAQVGDATVPAVGVRLFVDKVEIHDGFTFAGSRVAYRPSPPLGPGPHAVRVEAIGSEGGVGVEQWRFDVVPETTPAWGAVVLATATSVALGLEAAGGRRPRP